MCICVKFRLVPEVSRNEILESLYMGHNKVAKLDEEALLFSLGNKQGERTSSPITVVIEYRST